MRSLRQRWFLLLLLAGVVGGWFRPQWLRPATVRLEPRIVVAAALFLTAWSLESRRLVRSLTHPLPALWAFTMSYGALPALAWSGGRLLPDADLRLGLLVIASVPCTLSSAVLWTRMAEGNATTALLTVLLTTAVSWLVTPAWLAVGAHADVALEVSSMMYSLASVLVVPVGLGQLSRALGPLARTADQHQAVISTVARLFIFSIILKATVDVSDRLSQASVPLSPGWIVAATALCVGAHVIALVSGFWSSRLLHFDRADQIAVAFSGSQKTLPVSLYLFDAYFKEAHPLSLVPIVVYHVSQLIVDTLIADLLTRSPGKSIAASDGGA